MRAHFCAIDEHQKCAAMRKEYVHPDEEGGLEAIPSGHLAGVEVGPPTGLAAVAWYLLLVICHLLWGLFPVSCRYLQTKADPPLESMRLGFYVTAIAAVGLFTTYTIPVEVARRCCRTEIGLEEEAELPGKRHSLCEKVTALLVLAISLGVLAFGGILAANYTSANWLQLLYMTSPLLVALLARAVLGIPISPALWPALVLTLVGSGLVVYGGSAVEVAGSGLGVNDAIGIGIGFISMLGMAVFYVYVQKTEGVIAEEHVLYVEYATMCLTLPFLSLYLEPNDWGAVLHYGALEWGNLLFSSLGVYYGMNLLQQFIIRRIGASLFAMCTALRLVASIAGSWVLMGERINNWQEWTGSAIVALAITGYLIHQYFAASAAGSPASDHLLSLTPDSALTDPLLLAELNEITIGGGRTISSALPVLAPPSRNVDEAAIAATPGSLPSFSFKHSRSMSLRRR